MTLSNRKRQWVVGVCVALCLIAGITLGSRLWADMVITDTDTMWEGDVLSDDKNMIIIQTDKGILYLPRHKVKSASYARFPASSATVEEVIGTAEYERQGRPGDWRDVVVAMKLRPGDRIRTGDGSTVVLTVAGQSVTALEANTELTLDQMMRSREGDVKVRLNMDVGQLWNDVGTLRSAKSRYAVETPQASAGVRGTVYTILTDDDADETTVATVAGAVHVIQKTEDGETVDLGAGEQTSLRTTGAATTEAIDAELLREWDVYRNRFDSIRSRMELDNFFARFDDVFARVKLTGRQGVLASAGLLGFVVIVLGVRMARGRRRK